MTVTETMQNQIKERLTEAEILQEKYWGQGNLARSKLWANVAKELRRVILALETTIASEQKEN